MKELRLNIDKIKNCPNEQIQEATKCLKDMEEWLGIMKRKKIKTLVVNVKNVKYNIQKKHCIECIKAFNERFGNTQTVVNKTVVPTQVVEIPIPTMAKETATDTSKTDDKNVNKILPKKSPKTIDNLKKINYITNTNKSKNTKTGDKTMTNKNEIAKIAPIAVKNILAAQKTNKTDIKKTYWGGWSKVRAGMNATYNDYNKFQVLENQWAELRAKLGKSAMGHFCWGLINKNRVGVKQEPNASLRFIKNVKIRIAMANDVLEGKYTEKQIDDYINSLNTSYKQKYGLV